MLRYVTYWHCGWFTGLEDHWPSDARLHEAHGASSAVWYASAAAERDGETWGFTRPSAQQVCHPYRWVAPLSSGLHICREWPVSRIIPNFVDVGFGTRNTIDFGEIWVCSRSRNFFLFFTLRTIDFFQNLRCLHWKILMVCSLRNQSPAWQMDARIGG